MLGHPGWRTPAGRATATRGETPAFDGERLQQLENERALLAKIAARVPLAAVLDELLRVVEAHSDVEMLASILFLDKDGKHLLHGAAPSLPKAYNDAIHGVAIGPAVGSCGTAAFRGESVFVTDIANDALWADYRALALTHGLRACWSAPIKAAADGRVLGTFANYYREARSPTKKDLETISRASHTAALAIERHLSDQKLREGEARLQEALAAGRVMAYEWDPVTRRSHRSDNAAQILGVDDRSGSGSVNTFLARIHPHDRPRVEAHVFGVSRENPSFSITFRFKRPDGGEVWLEETASAEFDAAGRYLRLKGLTRDITGHKQAELALAERDAQLALAGKAALVGSYALDLNTQRVQVSPGCAAIHGLPESTTEIGRGELRVGVHPDDLERHDAFLSRAFAERRREYNVEYRILRSGGEVRWIEARAFISYGADGRAERVVGINIDVTDRKRAEERQSLLIAELDHRVKNVLARVAAVAQRTSQCDGSAEEFLEVFDGRIQSMAHAHALLSHGRWQGVHIGDLVQRELESCMGEENATVEGPEVRLPAEATQVAAMVLHELATNAAKHGALSTPHGRVTVRWHRWPERRWPYGAAPEKLVVLWQESGRPPVALPMRSGYGTSVIRDLIPYELGGKVDFSFAPDGVRCQLEIPLGPQQIRRLGRGEAADPTSMVAKHRRWIIASLDPPTPDAGAVR